MGPVSHQAIALHHQGAAAITAGRLDEGVALMHRALALDPACPLYHCDLGVAFHRLGRLEEAAAAYRQAVSLEPGFADALANLGSVLLNQRHPEEALSHLEKAVAANPSHALAHTNYGLALHALGRSREGMYYARKAVELAPQALAPLRSCAALLVELDRWHEAMPYCRRWVELEPENADARQALGGCYKMAGDTHEAARQYWKALQLNPALYTVANNLGLCLSEGGYDEAAVPLYRRATELNPDWAIGWTNLGETLRALGQGEAALQCHDRAFALDPDSPKVRWNRALCLLAMGKLEEGWKEYGWRCASEGSRLRPFSQPRWDGSSPAGKTILVWMEQGLGDEILFTAMLADLLRLGAHCVVECDPRLVTIVARSFPGVEAIPRTKPVHPRTQQRDIDFQIAAGSLARWFRPTVESFPQHQGYFIPDPALAAEWKRRVAALGDGLKVGICWRSMANKGTRARHYSQLNQWGPILTTPGARFVNLQYDQCDEELHEAERLFGVRMHVWDDLNLKDDQEGMAALTSALDLVISAPTAAHAIAGAVGSPNWVLIRGLANWWGLGTGRCPWLPSTRAFPCGATDPWEPVIERVASELRLLCNRSI